MSDRLYDALLLDLDGTLLGEDGRVRPRSLEALRAADEAGAKVMIATGRSREGTEGILEELGLSTPAVVVNGGGVYCPVRRTMLEERVLSNPTRDRAVQYAREHGLQAVVMATGRKFALRPRTEVEREALIGLENLEFLEHDAPLTCEYAVRVTVFSGRHATSEEFGRELEDYVGLPIYLTHFPLNMLPEHRRSGLMAADVHPPCRGKAEALRVLDELYNIPANRVVAIGDATNDLPMLRAAGLGVAMQNAMPEVFPHADRIIGINDSDAIADLVEELFLGLEQHPPTLA